MRYENSIPINNVVSHYVNQSKVSSANNETVRDAESNDKDSVSVNDKELFLRFYEELSLMIDAGYLDKDIVAETFAFYFIVAWEDDSWFWDNDMRDGRSLNEVKNSISWKRVNSLYKKLKNTAIGKEANVF